MGGLIKFPPARSAGRTSICSLFLRFSSANDQLRQANIGNKTLLCLQEALLEQGPADVDPR
jgi:hypothetical protein